MRTFFTSLFNRLKWLPIFAITFACIDRIIFPIPGAESQLVVEGMISDEPGPYIVLLSKAFSNRLPERSRDPVPGATVQLFEDNVFIASFVDQEDGSYKTDHSIRGRVGHTYSIKINTSDGREYTSAPEVLRSVGTINEIIREFEPAPIGEPRTDKFNIYVNSTPSLDPESYSRWRFTGTYRVISYPERAQRQVGDVLYPDPPACSGWMFDGWTLSQVRPCTCCECWITDKEKIPILIDVDLPVSISFKKIKVGEVPINQRTFHDSYRVEIEQYSLSKNVHEFYRLIKAQAESSGSLFQPSFGKITGNVTSSDPDERVLGVFYATSVYRKSVHIEKKDLPIGVPPIDIIADDCRVVGNATLTKPSFWP